MSTWQADIEIWPFFMGTEKDTGGRKQRLIIHADDIAGALKQAELFVAGIKTNPHVWQAPIKSIHQTSDMEGTS